MSLESFLPFLRPGKREAAEALYERLIRVCPEPDADIVFSIRQQEGLLRRPVSGVAPRSSSYDHSAYDLESAVQGMRCE